MNGAAAPPPTLRTARLVVAPFTLADAPFILRLLNEPSFHEHIGDKGVRSLEQAQAYLSDGPIRSYAANGFGLCRVALGEEGPAIGMCGLIRRDGFDTPDLGYAFVPEAWGRGLAREAAAATLAFGRERLGLDRVIALVLPGNTRSIRLLEALGFRYERRVALPGLAVEDALYALDLRSAEASA